MQYPPPRSSMEGWKESREEVRPEAENAVWIDRGWQPLDICFCPSAEAWQRLLNGSGHGPAPYPETAGATTLMRGVGAVVTLHGHETLRTVEVIGILAHETVHVVDLVIEAMRDDAPSAEFRAYAQQQILQDLVEAYEKCHGRALLAAHRAAD